MKRDLENPNSQPQSPMKRKTSQPRPWYDILKPWNWFTDFQDEEITDFVDLSIESNADFGVDELVAGKTGAQVDVDVELESRDVSLGGFKRDGVFGVEECEIDDLIIDNSNVNTSHTNGTQLSRSRSKSNQSPEQGITSIANQKQQTKYPSIFQPEFKRPTSISSPSRIPKQIPDLYSTPFKQKSKSNTDSISSSRPTSPTNSITTNFSSTFTIPNQLTRQYLQRHRLGAVHKKVLGFNYSN